MEISAKQREAENAERERAEFLRAATLPNFLKLLGISVGCWTTFIFTTTTDLHGEYADQLGLFYVPVALTVFMIFYYAAILCAVWFSFRFCYEWLAIVTLKTPVAHRGKVHFAGALILASLYPFSRHHDPLSALSKTLVYFEHHGFFVLKLAVIGAVVMSFAYSSAKRAVLRDFPRYPLHWYALLTIGSMIVGAGWRPESDMSSPFHWHEQIAYYTGAVVISFTAFFVGAQLGTRAEPDNAT